MAFSEAHAVELVPPLCSIKKYVVLQKHENSFVVVQRLQSYSGMKFILIAKILSISPKLNVTTNATRTEVQKCATSKLYDDTCLILDCSHLFLMDGCCHGNFANPLLKRSACLCILLVANWYMHMLFPSLLGACQFVHGGSHSKLRGLPHMYWFVSNTVCISLKESLLKTLSLILPSRKHFPVMKNISYLELTLTYNDAYNYCFLF